MPAFTPQPNQQGKRKKESNTLQPSIPSSLAWTQCLTGKHNTMSHLSPVLKSLTLFGLLMLYSQTLAMPLAVPVVPATPRCIWYQQSQQIFRHMHGLPSDYPDNPAKLVKSTCRLTMVYSLLRARNSTDFTVQLKDNLKTYIEGLCHEVSHSVCPFYVPVMKYF